MVPRVGILISKGQNQLLDSSHQTKFPGVIGWNLVCLAYKVFTEFYIEKVFDSFDCPKSVTHCYSHSSAHIITQMCVPSRHLIYKSLPESLVGRVRHLKNAKFYCQSGGFNGQCNDRQQTNTTVNTCKCLFQCSRCGEYAPTQYHLPDQASCPL